MSTATAAVSPSVSASAGIVFDNVCKFYGEVLGVNRVNLTIPRGITSLVGPNGSGKTTLMNLMTGLIRPSRGRITVRGIPTDDPERLFAQVGYCTQFDSFPRGMTGREFITAYLRLFGRGADEAARLPRTAMARDTLGDAADRRLAGYSKGMRQRIRLAQSLSHDPNVIILDEPLNGLDPLVRAESIALFQTLGAEGRHVILSSHVLHEVDAISDQVIMLSHGYVVAEGKIQEVRGEMREHPVLIRVGCNQPRRLAIEVLRQPQLLRAELIESAPGVASALLVMTRDADAFYLDLNRIVAAIPELEVTSVAPADDDAGSVYDYLVGRGQGAQS